MLSMTHITTLAIIYTNAILSIFFHFNYVNLGSKFDVIENYISNMKFQFDVIALSETWLRHDKGLNFNMIKH